MKGKCKTDCGQDIEYDAHEFSDGFVYYLPRNVDGTVHDCFMVGTIMQDCFIHDIEENQDKLEEIFQENKDKLEISLDEFLKNVWSIDQNALNYLGASDSMDFELMSMVRVGKMSELKNHLESQIHNVTAPFYGMRMIEMEMGFFDNAITINFEDASDDEVCMLVSIDLPTKKGYQLEYLGKFYEIMIRLEDAKKCYQLQYESTKEPEFLDIIEKLDEKIKNNKKNKQIISKIIDSDILKKAVDDTEEKIRQYIVALFPSNMNSVWKRLPMLYASVKKIHEKEQESIIPITEKNDVERLSLGALNIILKESKSKTKSSKYGECEICGKTWRPGGVLYFSKGSGPKGSGPKGSGPKGSGPKGSGPTVKEISCSDEHCFKNQGGLVTDVIYPLITNIHLITDARNVNSHPRDYDDEMRQHVFSQAFETCKIINYYIDDYLKKKNLI
jgi:hypothetical protein